jgi:hypothetical protein
MASVRRSKIGPRARCPSRRSKRGRRFDGTPDDCDDDAASPIFVTGSKRVSFVCVPRVGALSPNIGCN